MLYSKCGAGSALDAELDKYFTGAVSYYVSHPGNKMGMLFSGISGLMNFLSKRCSTAYIQQMLFFHEQQFIFIH